jgi:signal transduction histidine kinase
MKDAATEMLANMQVKFTTHSSITNVKDLTFRRNLILIYKEMLHNVQKHSQATQVRIDLEDNAGILTLRVKDNGKGFDEATIQRGHGLNSMQRRAKDFGGLLTVSSKAGQGTTSTLEVRIP